MRTGVFGGTFNPIHFGHLRAAEEVREKLSLDQVLFVPSGNPPLKDKNIADAEMRLRMVDLAIAQNPLFKLLDIECKTPGKSYTIITLQALRKKYPGAGLFFILGIDAFLDLPNWREPDKLLSIANFAVISRPGSSFEDLSASPYLDVETKMLKVLDSGQGGKTEIRTRSGMETVLVKTTSLEISSTEIRRRVKNEQSIKYLLPSEIELFIFSQKLYNK